MHRFNQRQVVLFITILVVVSLVALGTNTTIAGDAFKFDKAFKFDPKPVSIKPGCHISVNNRNSFMTSSRSTCRDLFLALEFIPREDFYRLLSQLAPDFSITKNRILNERNSLKVYYQNSFRDGFGKDFFRSITSTFSSETCETIEFRGVRLHCFNELDSGKRNNLRYPIHLLSFVRYTSNMKHQNPLLNERVWAWDVVHDRSRIELYDGSEWDVLVEEKKQLEDHVNQCESGAAAFHTTVRQEEIVVLCPKMLRGRVLDTERGKIHNAGVLYHEANHVFNELSHNVGRGNPNGKHVTCPNLRGEVVEGASDRDFVGPYGAQIEYLLSLSQNNILSCSEREIAYDDAREQLENNLCHDVRRPRIRQDRPRC